MRLRRLPNGNLLIPAGIYHDDIMGDDVVEISPDDPRYAEWEPYLGTEWDETDVVIKPPPIDVPERITTN